MSEEAKKNSQAGDSSINEIAKSKKSEKPASKAKPALKKENFLLRSAKNLKKWAREIKSEMKKVLWPTRSQTIQNTMIVIVCVVIVGAFIWAFDGLAGLGVQALINTVKG